VAIILSNLNRISNFFSFKDFVVNLEWSDYWKSHQHYPLIFVNRLFSDNAVSQGSAATYARCHVFMDQCSGRYAAATAKPHLTLTLILSRTLTLNPIFCINNAPFATRSKHAACLLCLKMSVWFFFKLHGPINHKFKIVTHTNARLTALCPVLPGWAGTIKVKPVWILLKQETVSGSGISWAICKSAPRSRHITTPAPRLNFYRPDALPAAQPTVSKHWRQI